MRWKDSWLQTNLPRRLSTDAEVNPTCSLRDQTFWSGQHYGRNKERTVDSKNKIESEENGQHVQRLQGSSTKTYGATTTADMPQFRVEGSKPFETTRLDFAGPIAFKIAKKEQGKCYFLLFTCATLRAVHLELTKTHTAEEFQRKLNLFITRRTRPKVMISDNASVFKSTATWMKNIRKNERLQDYLARQDINWQSNLSRSPWWGGMCERLIKDMKKTLHKTLGHTHLTFEQLEAVVIDVTKNLNNRPLTYLDSDGGEEQVLTPNVLMWRQNAHPIEVEKDEEETSALNKRLREAKNHA